MTQLLALQERDHNILRVQSELADLEPQRKMLHAKAEASQASLETARAKLRQIEAKRKESELEVEAQKQLIDKYSLQQFQTKKNEEYRALAHEIQMCRDKITEQEDQQLEFMEQAEAVQKELHGATHAAREVQSLATSKLGELAKKEQDLESRQAELLSNRAELAEAVDESARIRYERLLKHKGERVIVGVAHGVCGGCHMKLPIHVIISCQTEGDLVTCPNCGRILYFSADMDLTPAD